MKKTCDIFISYRRHGSGELAYIVYQQLEKAGYSVFFDLEKLHGGRFGNQLYDRIAECTDFLLILPPGGLDNCRLDDDWVRQEIRHALRHQKNIVPVLLPGFSRPERDSLPEEIRPVLDWQAIQSGPIAELPELVRRLADRKFLVSNPRPPSLFRRMLPATLVAAVLLLAAIGGLIWRGEVNRQQTAKAEYAAVCMREADAVAHAMTVFHQTLVLSDATLSYWRQFYPRYAAAGPEARRQIVSDARQFLAHQQQQLATALASVPPWQRTETERKILARGTISLADLDAFHQSVYPSMIRDFQSTLTTLQTYLDKESIPQFSIKHLQFSHDIYAAQIKSLYYQYLALLATMPESARADYRKISTDWPLFPNDLPSADPADLEANADREMKRAETLTGQFANYVSALEGGAALNDPEWKKAMQHYLQAQTEESLKRAQAHGAELDEMRTRFLETDKKLTAGYERAARQFAIHTGDDPDLMWGKVLRMATIANNALLQRTAAAKRNRELAAAAREQGTDTRFLTDMPYTITVDDLFGNVRTWLNDCERNMPATAANKARFEAARCFYRDVALGELPCEGIIAIGTKDDLPHPVYRVGDIVTRRNGQPVRSVEEYQAQKPPTGEDVVTIVRYTPEGHRETLHTPLPETAVLTAFLPLVETNL